MTDSFWTRVLWSRFIKHFRKLTDEQIIKGLEICGKEEPCEECPYNGTQCLYTLPRDAADLVNRQKAEIDDLKVGLDTMRGAANSYKMHYEEAQAEIERLKSENKSLIENDVRNKYPNCVSVEKGRIYTRTLEDYDELIGDISAEAIKEFAERLYDNVKLIPDAYLGIEYEINALVKEMTEGKNA
jgi:hypothetical protein